MNWASWAHYLALRATIYRSTVSRTVRRGPSAPQLFGSSVQPATRIETSSVIGSSSGVTHHRGQLRTQSPSNRRRVNGADSFAITATYPSVRGGYEGASARRSAHWDDNIREPFMADIPRRLGGTEDEVGVAVRLQPQLEHGLATAAQDDWLGIFATLIEGSRKGRVLKARSTAKIVTWITWTCAWLQRRNINCSLEIP